MSMASKVEEFHRAVGHPVQVVPTQLEAERLRLRLSLIGEEFVELAFALCGKDSDSVEAHACKEEVRGWLHALMASGSGVADLVDVARQIADLHYVLSGTSVEHGIPESAVFAEVHAANMRKVGGGQRGDGKVQRPEGWQPPNVAGVLRRMATREAQTS